ncbi:MAG: ribosome-associated translation inhibitor RaiA [Coriobacteriia bacterium]|nr:ribosome-associated translation inhibitor RaiA [Coriobacteriia bacterium]
MDISISGRRISISDELRTYINDRIEQAVKVFKIDPMTIEVVARHEQTAAQKDRTTAEITLRTKGHVIRTESSDEDIKAAVDIASAKLERQLRKYKTRVVEKRKAGPKISDVLADPVIAAADLQVREDALLAAQKENESDGLVRVKELSLDILDIDEAMLRMDLVGHDFFVFVNSLTGLTCVLYRRHDGGYGLISPRVEKAGE